MNFGSDGDYGMGGFHPTNMDGFSRSVDNLRRQIVEISESSRRGGVFPSYGGSYNHYHQGTEEESQGSRILLLSKLPEHLQNPDAVFFMMENFGPVERVKILNKKRYTALVQMSYSEDAVRALREFDGLMERVGHDICIVEATNVSSIKLPKAGQEFMEGTKDFTLPETGLPDYPSDDFQRGSVVLVSNLPERLQNVDYIFNLFGHYGNVDRIKIPVSKRSCALVQYSKPHYCLNAKKYLDEVEVDGSRLSVSFSLIREVRKSTRRDQAELNKDFRDEGSIQRFKNKERATRIQKNLCSPTATIHVSNLEEALREEDVRRYFIERDFTVKDVLDFKNGMAVITLASAKEGVMALATCHGDNEGIASKKSLGIFISFSKRVK